MPKRHTAAVCGSLSATGYPAIDAATVAAAAAVATVVAVLDPVAVVAAALVLFVLPCNP